jgi:hypothetical protein
MRPKFTGFDAENNEAVYEYGKVFEVETTAHYSRLKIGASQSAVDLMLNLADCLGGPYFVLYVLLIARDGEYPGRYQSPPLATQEELANFLREFRLVLESDGRHHIWIGTADSKGLIIYDQHNVIYAYGPLECYQTVVKERSFIEQAFDFPSPHGHSYNAENDAGIRSLLAYWDWQHFPLVADEDTLAEE